ncbi:hypothetical protein HK102_007895 [Quaeritorhiza haematococci]|nr:hypothetical protein HK102_007895 [Quaeritorhiza haematococci]
MHYAIVRTFLIGVSLATVTATAASFQPHQITTPSAPKSCPPPANLDVQVLSLGRAIKDSILTLYPNANDPIPSPIWRGNYDLHSSIHAHWALATIARTTNNTEFEKFIVDRVGVDEIATLNKFWSNDENDELPYGQAWLLLLLAELSHRPHLSSAPVFQALVKQETNRMLAYLGRAPFPENDPRSSSRQAGPKNQRVLILQDEDDTFPSPPTLPPFNETRVRKQYKDWIEWTRLHSSSSDDSLWIMQNLAGLKENEDQVVAKFKEQYALDTNRRFIHQHKSWLFAFMITQLALRTLAPNRIPEMDELYWAKIVPVRSDLRDDRKQEFGDFMYLPAILDVIERTATKRHHLAYGDDDPVPHLPSQPDFWGCHGSGAYATRLWPFALIVATSPTEARIPLNSHEEDNVNEASNGMP